MEQNELKIGDTVSYRGGFGMDPPTTVEIVGFGEKNDRPLADLDNGHWCYLNQIERVLAVDPASGSAA